MPDLLGGADWKVYQVNDYEWYVARSRDEAIAIALHESGGPPEEYEDTSEVGQEAMEYLRFTDTDEDENPIGEPRSFREELERRVAAGLREGELFAASEP